jgi:hypothetical protein
MSWLRVDGDLSGHPKLKRLALLTGVDQETLLGKLVAFWAWAQKYAEDGDISRFDPAEIALSFNLPVGQETLKNLIASGFIDSFPYLRIHDWWEYNGMWLIAKYKKSPTKWKRIRRLYNSTNQGTHKVTVTGTVTSQLGNSEVTAHGRNDTDVELQDPHTPASGGLASQQTQQPEPGNGAPPNAPAPRPARKSLRALGINPRAIRRKAITLKILREREARQAFEQVFDYDMSPEEMTEIRRRNMERTYA